MRTPFFSFTHLFPKPGAKASPRAGVKTRRNRAEDAPADDNENPDAAADDGSGEDEDAGEGQAEGEDDPDGDQAEEDDDSQEQAEGEEDDAPAPSSKAARKARADERARIGAIVTAPEASGRLQTALHIALNTSMGARAAREMLKATPKAAAPTTGSRLDAAMGAHPRPHIGTRAGAGSTKPTAGLDTALDAEIARMKRG